MTVPVVARAQNRRLCTSDPGGYHRCLFRRGFNNSMRQTARFHLSLPLFSLLLLLPCI